MCPCINAQTRQPDPSCTLCEGRGSIYKNPGPQSILQEQVRHDSAGRVYPTYTPVSGTPTVTLRDVELSLGTPPVDGSYIQLATPYPKSHEPLMANYDYSPIVSVTDEDSDVIGTNTLRVTAPMFSESGKSFEGSVNAVTRVYNSSKEETYTVSNYAKEYIYLSSTGTWESGDSLEVDYSYVKPFPFMLSQVSMKMRYEQAYVLDQADTVMVTPYWAKISSNDLFTALASEQYAAAVVDPRFTTGNDEIKNYYDIAKLVEIIDSNGTEYTVGTNVELYGRNELKWLTTKPTVKYTATFHYHPTYVALDNLPTLRTSENKSFVNRVNLKLRDKTDGIDF